MYRTRGKVLGVALAIAATGLLAACGDNDSTASHTPSVTTSPAAGSSPQTDADDKPAPEQSKSAEKPAPEAKTEDKASPAPPAPSERPKPITPPAQGDEADLDEKEKAFITGLRDKGIKPTPDIAINTGNYICQSLSAGDNAEQRDSFVRAMVGSDPSFDPDAMPVEEAAQIYMDVAEASYCS